MKKAIIIQARMSSSRLPGKVLMDIYGKSMLSRMIEQLSYSKKISEVIVSTSIEKSDDQIYDFCQKEGISCFRGSLTNVLKRFVECANYYNIDLIIRAYADCPLLDPSLIDDMVDIYLNDKDIDYINNTHIKGAVHGAGCELVTKNALQKSLKLIDKIADYQKKSYYLEHVTTFIRESEDNMFNKHYMIVDKSICRSDIFYTVDYPQDFELTKILFKKLYNPRSYIATNAVIDYLDKNPYLIKTNAYLHKPLPLK